MRSGRCSRILAAVRCASAIGRSGSSQHPGCSVPQPRRAWASSAYGLTQCFSTNFDVAATGARPTRSVSVSQGVEGYSRYFLAEPDRESRLSVPLQLVRKADFWRQLPIATGERCSSGDAAIEGAVWCRTPVVRGRYFRAEPPLARRICARRGGLALRGTLQDSGACRFADERGCQGAQKIGLFRSL